MKEKLLELLWDLEKEKYPDYNKKADEIIALFNVSSLKCKCKHISISWNVLSESYLCNNCQAEVEVY